MTDVNKDNDRLIATEAEALALYTRTLPAALAGKMGIEVEMGVFAPGDPKLRIPTALEMLRLQEELKKRGQGAQLEAAGVVEYASPPVAPADVVSLMARAEDDLAVFEEVMRAQGWRRSPVCVLPTVTLDDALAACVPRERLQAALSAIPHVWGRQALSVPLLTAGVQVSFSPKDPEEMFRMARRAYALTPLLMLATNSSSGFAENDPAPRKCHLRGTAYDTHRDSGGIARSFTRAVSGIDWMEEHVRTVFDTSMLFAYNRDGSLLRSGQGRVLTFRDLIALGLNTQSNFELAESFLYHDVKICNLRDAFGQVAGKRLEIRAADSGLHQPFSVLLITAALIPDGPASTAFEALLGKYGFTGDPRLDAPLLHTAREGVVADWRAAMDGGFGTGRMCDFMRDVAQILEDHYAHMNDRRAHFHLRELLDIMRQDHSDAALNGEEKTLRGAVRRILRGRFKYPDRHAQNP